MEILKNLKEEAKKSQKSNKKLAAKLRKLKPGKVDEMVHSLHDDVFEEVDCLECANCCKSISPIVTDKDIQRLAKHFRIKPADFVEKYLYMDDEMDYVYKETPCPFLGDDNYCSVYEVRPKACAEYPHTDRRKFTQILNLSIKNTKICPAVYKVFEQLKKDLA